MQEIKKLLLFKPITEQGRKGGREKHRQLQSFLDYTQTQKNMLDSSFLEKWFAVML